MRGHPRSGTNWVSNLLNLHPQVCCTGEFHFETIYNAVNRTMEVPWHLVGKQPVRGVLESAFQDLIRRCIVSACGEQGCRALWLGDRTPSDLLYWMPDARYIWVLRDGRDVAVSWTFHQLRKGPKVIELSIPPHASEGLLGLSQRFLDDPTMFDRHPELLLADEAWVRHFAGTWDRRLRSDSGTARPMVRAYRPCSVMQVRYEELHARTAEYHQALLRFLDLDPQDAEPISEASHTIAGYRAPNPLSYRRKGVAGDWPKYFTSQTTKWFDQVAGDSLREAGYNW